MIKLALLGFGTVGKGTFSILENKKEEIKNILGEEVVVSKILKRNLDFKTDISKELFTDNIEDIINDKDIKLVCEMTGDKISSYNYIKLSLVNKKHVVTANKAVVSEYFEEFLNLARENNVKFLYESSVAGSIPIIEPLKKQSVINDIVKVRGILNGTSNYILHKMTSEGLDYKEVLKDAQDKGYAEADPTDDVEGLDALRKLRILSTIAFKSSIYNNDIEHFGLSSISKNDIDYLKEKEYKVKLVAESYKENDKYMSIVEPVILGEEDKLYNILNAENSVEIVGENYRSLTFTGEGAGMYPTGNAVVTDIIDALIGEVYPVVINRELLNNNDDYKAVYYLRVEKDINLDNISDEIEIYNDKKIIKTKKIKRKDLISSLEKLEDKNYFFARYN